METLLGENNTNLKHELHELGVLFFWIIFSQGFIYQHQFIKCFFSIRYFSSFRILMNRPPLKIRVIRALNSCYPSNKFLPVFQPVNDPAGITEFVIKKRKDLHLPADDGSQRAVYNC